MNLDGPSDIVRHSRVGLADYLRALPHPGGIIVCAAPPFIYMKAPRTGGTSILRGTLEKLPLDVFHFKDHRPRFEDWLSHVTDRDLENFFICSFVRNPWDRAVSIARYFQIPFLRFARDYDRLIAGNRTLCQHALPLHTYTHMGDRQFVDFIGRFEMLQASFERLCERLGLESREIPHANRSDRTDYQDYYDAESQQQIDSLFGRDAELYGYRFDDGPHDAPATDWLN